MHKQRRSSKRGGGRSGSEAGPATVREEQPTTREPQLYAPTEEIHTRHRSSQWAAAVADLKRGDGDTGGADST